MPDPYTTITSQTEETLDTLAGILEMRGKEAQQVRLKEKILQTVRGKVLEVESTNVIKVLLTKECMIDRLWYWTCHQAPVSSDRGGVSTRD